MARKAKKKAKAARQAKARRSPARRAKTRKAKTRKVKTRKTRKARKAKTKKAKSRTRKSAGTTMKSARKQQEPIPAEPAGRIGLKRPSNRPKAPGAREPREIAQAEPDARFDDPRAPEHDAREYSDGLDAEEQAGYRNTDERF